MVVDLKEVEGFPGRFFAMQRNGSATPIAEIAVQFPSEDDRGENRLLVFFWSGKISPPVVASGLDRAEKFLNGKGSPLSRTFFAYGVTKFEKTLKPSDPLLSGLMQTDAPPTRFKIYRAEITAASDVLSIWVNVCAPYEADLQHGVENISISLTPTLLKAGGAHLVFESVKETRPHAIDPLSGLMTTVSDRLGV